MPRCRARTQPRGYSGSKQCSRNAMPDSFFCRQHQMQGSARARTPPPTYTPEQIVQIEPDFSMGQIRQIEQRQGMCRTAEICLESGIGWTPSFFAIGLQQYEAYFSQNGQNSMARDLRQYYNLLSNDFTSAYPEVKQGFAPMPELNTKWQNYLRDLIASCEPYMETPEGYESAINQVRQREEMRQYTSQILDLATNLSRNRTPYPEQSMNWYRSRAENMGRNFEEDLAAAQEYVTNRSAQAQEFREASNEWNTRMQQAVAAAREEYEENNPSPALPNPPRFSLDA